MPETTQINPQPMIMNWHSTCHAGETVPSLHQGGVMPLPTDQMLRLVVALMLQPSPISLVKAASQLKRSLCQW